MRLIDTQSLGQAARYDLQPIVLEFIADNSSRSFIASA